MKFLSPAPGEGNCAPRSMPRTARALRRGGVDGIVNMVDAASGAILFTFKAHSGGVTSIGFSPDGKWLVTGSDDRTARVWDAATGKEKFVLRGHNGTVNGVAVSPDGKLILTASTDKTARLWDAATGSEVSILRGHTDGVTGAAFSPDGKFIATSSSDRTARITLTAIQDIFDLALTRATLGLSCDEWKGYLQENDYCPSLDVKSGGGGGSSAVAADKNTPPAVGLAAPTPAAAATAEQLPAATALPTETTIEAGAGPSVESATPMVSPSPSQEQATAAATLAATAEPTEAPIPAATAAPTEMPTPLATSAPTGAPTLAPTETHAARPSPTAAAAVPTTANTAVPQAPPGVYATNIRYAPIDPNAKPTQLVFTVDFLNTTGAAAGFKRWMVLIYRQGETKSFGDTRGVNKSFPSGASAQEADPYQINLGVCENFTAVPAWEDNDGRRTPFTQPDGSSISVPFQLCP